MQLFNAKTIKRHIARAPVPDPAKLEILRQWGDAIRSTFQTATLRHRLEKPRKTGIFSP